MSAEEYQRSSLREINVCLCGAIEFCCKALDLVEEVDQLNRSGAGAAAADKLLNLVLAVESMIDNFRFLRERLRAAVQGQAH